MSQTTQARSAARKEAAPVQAQEPVTNGHDTQETVAIEIGDIEVTVPRKFRAGLVMTENQAKVLDAAYQRQFRNNQIAMATARAEKLAKATTDAERQAAAPLTATDLAKLYETYEPNVGGSRMGSMEKVRNDAAWRMWTALVAEHNANVRENGTGSGYVPVIAKAGKAIVPGLAPIKGTDGKVVAGGTVPEQRDRLIARILQMPEYADRVQFHVDAILAERKGSKDDGNKAEEQISVASLFD